MGRFHIAVLVSLLLTSVMGCRRNVPSETPPEGASRADASSGEATDSVSGPEVTEAIFQVVLDIPELELYWHVGEAPDRSPLLVLVNDITPAELALIKFDEPVQILASEEIGERPYFEFRSLEQAGNRASVSFAYDVEGVIGTVELELTEGLWIVLEQSLAEQ